MCMYVIVYVHVCTYVFTCAIVLLNNILNWIELNRIELNYARPQYW